MTLARPLVTLAAALATLAFVVGGCATTAGPGRGPNDPNSAASPGSPGDVSTMNEVTKPSAGASHGVAGDPPQGNPQLDRGTGSSGASGNAPSR